MKNVKRISIILMLLSMLGSLSTYAQRQQEEYSVSETSLRKPLFVVKTNLLFDALSALNVEIEVPVGKRWSIAGEWIFPWWLWSNKQYCMQVLNGNIELRYWLNNHPQREVLTGWFAGLYTGGGLYDLEWKQKGYQGEFFIASGLSMGYAHRIGRSFNMEYSLGLGYLRTKYRQYDALKDANGEWNLIRGENGHFNWVGPTRAKVSLIWIPPFKHNKKGRRGE